MRCRQESLAIARRLGDQYAIANALSGIGYIDYTHGRYQDARDHLQASLAAARSARDRSGQAAIRTRLGMVYSAMGDLGHALENLTSL